MDVLDDKWFDYIRSFYPKFNTLGRCTSMDPLTFPSASVPPSKSSFPISTPLDGPSVGGTVLLGTIAIKHAARAEVGLAAERTEDVADIVGWRDADGEGTVPLP